MADDAFKVESDKTNVSLTIASVAGEQRIFKLTGLAHEITCVKVAQKTEKQTVSLKLAKREEKTWHKLLDDRQHATESSQIASTKEAVANDTANNNTSTTSRVCQTTLSDFSKKLEEPPSTEKEESIDDQTRIMDSHAVQCEKEYWSDLPLFLPGKIVMEQHHSTPSPSQSWSKETKSSGFEESVGDSINDQNSEPTVNPGGHLTVMELANDSKFSGEQTTITTRSLNTMGTKRKHKIADADRMQADSLKKGDPGSWTSENGNELQTARSIRAGVSDEVAQEFQVISKGNANIECPQVNFQNEISDPDEYAKATNVTAVREAVKTDFL